MQIVQDNTKYFKADKLKTKQITLKAKLLRINKSLKQFCFCNKIIIYTGYTVFIVITYTLRGSGWMSLGEIRHYKATGHIQHVGPYILPNVQVGEVT